MKILVLAVASIAASAAAAQPSLDRHTFEALRITFGMCISDAFSFDLMTELAEMDDWKPVTGAAARLMTPAHALDDFRVWQGFGLRDPDDGARYPFIAFGGRDDAASADAIEICGAYFTMANVEVFIEEFTLETGAKLLARDTSAAEVSHIFSLPEYDNITATIRHERMHAGTGVFLTTLHQR